MTKINLLMTGLASSCTEEFKISNIDYTWLIKNPSTLLWADNIFLTNYMKDSLFINEDTPREKSLNLVFDILNDFGIIKFKNSKKVYNEKISNELDKIISDDLDRLSENSDIKIERCNMEDPRNIRVGELHYCLPQLKSIYASLIISESWNAHCLFSDSSINFLKYKLNYFPENSNVQPLTYSFENIFSLILPDVPIFPSYSFLNDNSECKRCINLKKCDSTYLNLIEENLIKYLEMRDFEEIIQMKNIIHESNQKIMSNDFFVDSDLVLKEFLEQKRLIFKKMHTSFPKLKKWSNYSMIASAAVGSAGYLSGSNILTGIGLGLEALSILANNGINYIEEKNKWVGFKVEDKIFNQESFNIN